MSRTFYSEYVNHCLRFYARHDRPKFHSEADKHNWAACDSALKSFSDNDRAMLLYIYREGDTLAGLKGKRFVTMSESNEYGKLDEEKIKQLTGGEEISARALYQSAITFKPQFTLWLSCNDLPMVTDKSLFASERIKVVEFNRHFSPEEQDTHLKDELCEQSSMSGIFMWLVRGYIHYKERGLAMSGSLKSVVTKYERDNDLVLQFLENRCERVPEESSPTVIKAKDLYNAFKIWAKSEGAYILSARKFNSEMERHPEWFDRKSTSSGYATYCGLKLKEVL